MSSKSLKERLKARKEKMRHSTDSDSPRKLLANDDDEDPSDSATAAETEDSAGMVMDLKKRRRRAQKELSETVEGEEEGLWSVAESLKSRQRQRISQTTNESESPSTEPANRETNMDMAGDLQNTTDLDNGTKRRKSSDRTRNMRASIKEKIKAAKERSKDEAYDETRAFNRKLKGKRNMISQTRFDRPSVMKKEDFELEEALEKTILARTSRRECADSLTPSFLPSQQEQFDFFTVAWEPEPEEPPEIKEQDTHPGGELPESEEAIAGPSGEQASTGTDTTKETENASAEIIKKAKDKPEDEQPLIDAEFSDTPSPWEFYQVGRANYISFHEKLEAEKKMYFYPSMLAAPRQDKMFETQTPRYLEEEGFYVGTKPQVSRRSTNRMENRLLAQPDTSAEWFGEDCRIISLPDPVKQIQSRPIIPEVPDPALALIYEKAVVIDYDSRLIDGTLDGSGLYQLDVDINTMVFTHHHLFSREHVLASRLTMLYNQYIQTTKQKPVFYLTDKLKALKNARAHVQENINLMMLDEDVDKNATKRAIADQHERLEEYKEEMKLTRKEREQEICGERTLLRSIIDTWKEIRALRDFQEFTNTAVKLKIQKKLADKAADERQWEEDIGDELAELQADAEQEFQSQLEIFTISMEAWKQQKQAKKEAAKRQKKRERVLKAGSVDSVDGDEDLAQEDSDMRILAELDVEKPKRPKQLDVSGERTRLITHFEATRRMPGEAELFPKLTSEATITQNSLCSADEQQRRNDVARYKLYIKVLFNNKEVSQTSPRPLGQDFTVRFAQIFNIQIVQWPESMTLRVYEQGGLLSELLTKVYVAIPDANVTSDSVHLDVMEYSCDHRVVHPHEGVGSGVSIVMDQAAMKTVTLCTSGHLSISVAWAVSDDGTVLVPPIGPMDHLHSVIKTLDAVAAIGAAGMSDFERLNKWITKSHLDPNDPNNADLMQRVKASPDGAFEIRGHFRLEQLQEEFNFTTDEELVKSRRYKAILLREKEIPEFRGYKMIPALEREIPDSIFEEYEKKKRDEEKVRNQELTSHRVAVSKFMQRVREQVMERFLWLQHQKVLSDMVYEELVPNIGTIIPNLLKITEPRRPLKPIRKERKKMTAQNLKQENVRLLINIVRAFDIPVRTDAVENNPRQSDGQATNPLGNEPVNLNWRQGVIKNIAGETLVRPFVEVMFQRYTQMTSVAEGPNPSWNEELHIPFKAPNDDYSSASLQSIKDNIYINLFDEYIVDVLQDDRERGTSIHRRIERRWLGAIKIPFSTIYHNSRIDGTFRLNKPPVLLGYQHDPKARNMEAGIDLTRGLSEHTYLTMFITVEPQLTPSEAVNEKYINMFETHEDDKLVAEAEKWLGALEKHNSKRAYKAMVIDINGKTVFMTRYFKGLAPPEELTQREATAQFTRDEGVARYVSLIPFLSDNIIFPGVCDIWSTCDQFLQMLQGDEEEHAVLLTCFFLHLGKRAYLLLGSAIPEGSTAYVLTREESKDYWIWNASTGEHFSCLDNYCPVQRVACVVNAQNIWANIQQNEQPCRMQFDVHNSTNWKPFFHKGFPHPGLSSVQPESLIYTEPDKNEVADIQDKVERTLREKIMEWRPRHVTRWNRYCIQAFRQILPKLETNGGKVPPQQMTELEQLNVSYKLSGFPINMPYTDVESLVEAVYATGVHINETNDVEYALAVYMHPYPCSVISVWIYVASLSRKR